MSDLVFSAEEQAIIDHLTAAFTGILDLGLRSDTTNLRVELASAVHTLQMFPVKHMLQRLDMAGMSKWFEK